MPAAATPAETLDRHIGRAVRDLLFVRGAQQKDLAAHLDVDPTVVSKMIHGMRSWTIVDLWGTAEFLGCSPGDLLTDDMRQRWVSAMSDQSAPVTPGRRGTRWYRRLAGKHRVVGSPHNHPGMHTQAEESRPVPTPRAGSHDEVIVDLTDGRKAG